MGAIVSDEIHQFLVMFFHSFPKAFRDFSPILSWLKEYTNFSQLTNQNKTLKMSNTEWKEIDNRMTTTRLIQSCADKRHYINSFWHSNFDAIDLIVKFHLALTRNEKQNKIFTQDKQWKSSRSSQLIRCFSCNRNHKYLRHNNHAYVTYNFSSFALFYGVEMDSCKRRTAAEKKIEWKQRINEANAMSKRETLFGFKRGKRRITWIWYHRNDKRLTKKKNHLTNNNNKFELYCVSSDILYVTKCFWCRQNSEESEIGHGTDIDGPMNDISTH